jgi:transglutaminase/protease-like cytokinesis protein 3
VPGEGIDHAWNAVFISGSWRLLDCTWGAGKTDAAGQHFKKQLDEHFFIADPDELIYTHFPYDEVS